MPPSVTQPVGQAIERAKRICFQPFYAGKWFRLGFCAFLANLGLAGGGGSEFRGAGTRTGGSRGLSELLHWVEHHVALVCLLGVAALVVFLGLSLLFYWLHCRGRFMLLDGVVRNCGAVVEPWHALRAPANSLLGLYLVLLLVGVVFSLLAGGACLAVAWPDLHADRFGDGAMASVVLAVVLFLPFTIAMAVVQVIVRDFVAPTMYLRGTGVRAAWATVSRTVLASNGPTILLYLLMKLVLGLGIGVIAVVVMLATCCLAALPYLGTVILLPLFVFSQCYPLCFLEQFGPQWRFFVDEPGGHYCRICGHHLPDHGHGVCPRCGALAFSPSSPPSAAPPTSPP